MPTKLCRRCNRMLPKDAFQFKRKGSPKRHSQCRVCRNALHLQWTLSRRENDGNLFAFVRKHNPARASRLDKHRANAKSLLPMACGDLMLPQSKDDEYSMFYTPKIV